MMRSAILAIALGCSLYGADLSGVWVLKGSGDIAAAPGYTPEFQKVWQERKKDLKAQDPATYCLPDGVVRVTSLPYKIVQADKLVVILSEGNTHSFRRVFMDGRPHNLDLEPETWTGDSTGKWDGDVLVVDTIGFNDRTWLDSTGKPHSEALHVVERYRRVSPTRLDVQYTVEDPKALTKPLSFTRTFEAVNRDLQEQFCTHLNHLESKKQ
jgi:hypothetical protein